VSLYKFLVNFLLYEGLKVVFLINIKKTILFKCHFYSVPLTFRLIIESSSGVDIHKVDFRSLHNQFHQCHNVIHALFQC